MSVTGLTTAGAAPGSSSRTTAMAGQATRRTLRDRLLGFTDPHRGRIASERPPSGYGSLAAEPKTFSSGRRTTGVRRAARVWQEGREQPPEFLRTPQRLRTRSAAYFLSAVIQAARSARNSWLAAMSATPTGGIGRIRTILPPTMVGIMVRCAWT